MSVCIIGIVKTYRVSYNEANGKQTKSRSHVCLVEEVRILTECGHKAKREENVGEEKVLSLKGSGVLEYNSLVDFREQGMNETSGSSQERGMFLTSQAVYDNCILEYVVI